MDPRDFLVKLAPQSAAAWLALGATCFPGTLTLETGNTLYVFEGGLFTSRAKKGGGTPELPAAMVGVRLIGFLSDVGGLWALSPRWREGAHAVLWRENGEGPRAFLITSPTSSFVSDRPSRRDPDPDPWATSGPTPATPQRPIRPNSGPPTLRRPQPPSMTRMHRAAPRGAGR